MSEDPVKYEPLDDDTMATMVPMKEWRQMLAKLTELDGDVGMTRGHLIRIEALRAAARITAGLATTNVVWDIAPAEHSLALAKKFAAYLESGE